MFLPTLVRQDDNHILFAIVTLTTSKGFPNVIPGVDQFRCHWTKASSGYFKISKPFPCILTTPLCYLHQRHTTFFKERRTCAGGKKVINPFAYANTPIRQYANVNSKLNVALRSQIDVMQSHISSFAFICSYKP